MKALEFVLVTDDKGVDNKNRLRAYPDLYSALILGNEMDNEFPLFPRFFSAKADFSSYEFPFSTVEQLEISFEIQKPNWYDDPFERDKIYWKLALQYMNLLPENLNTSFIQNEINLSRKKEEAMEQSFDKKKFLFQNGPTSFREYERNIDLSYRDYMSTVEGKLFHHSHLAIDALHQAMTFAIKPFETAEEEINDLYRSSSIQSLSSKCIANIITVLELSNLDSPILSDEVESIVNKKIKNKN